MPLFSVIIPSYNREKLVEATLDSVLAQDFDDYEIVVADDGSKDGTADVVARYAEKFPDKVKLHVQVNKGEGAARNLAIKHAAGEYLAYLDSDDVYFPWSLSTFAQAISENNRPASIVGFGKPFYEMGDLKTVSQTDYKAKYWPDMFAFADENNDTFPPSCTVMRRDVVEKVGLFLERNINSVDVDLWMRVGDAKGFVRIYLPVIAGRREHLGNISGNKEMMIQGANNLMAREANGVYPGGSQRKRARMKFLLFHVRWMMVQCIKAGRQGPGWKLYRASFAWHVRLGRVRCLLGFPVMALAEWVKPRPTK